MQLNARFCLLPLLILLLVACPPAPPPTPVPSPAPAPIPAVRLAASGERTCLLRAADTVCWGTHDDNLPGEPLEGWRLYPTEDAAEIALGSDYLCARYPSGQVRCWTSPSDTLLLGRGDPMQEDAAGSAGAKPQVAAKERPSGVVPGLSGVVQLVGSALHVCALNGDGETSCWGVVPHKIGHADYGSSSFLNLLTARTGAAEPVPQLSPAKRLAASAMGTCAILRQGGVRCMWWIEGEMTAPQTLPLVAQRIALGKQAACAVLADGSVQCFGAKSDGAKAVPDLRDAVDIAGSDESFCARRRNGQLACWTFEAIQDQPFANLTLKMAGAADVSAVTMGKEHLCVRKDAGQVHCIGSDAAFQLARKPWDGKRRIGVKTIAAWAGAKRIQPNSRDEDMLSSVCAHLSGALLCIDEMGSRVRYEQDMVFFDESASISRAGEWMSWELAGGYKEVPWFLSPDIVEPNAVSARRVKGPPDIVWMDRDGDVLRDGSGQWWHEDKGAYRRLSGWSDVKALDELREGGCLLKKDGALHCFRSLDIASLDPSKIKSEPTLRSVARAAHGLALTAAGKLYLYDEPDTLDILDDDDDDEGWDEEDSSNDVGRAPRLRAMPHLPTNIASFTGSSDCGCAITRMREVHCWGGLSAFPKNLLRGAEEAVGTNYFACGRFASGEVRCVGSAPFLMRDHTFQPVRFPETKP